MNKNLPTVVTFFLLTISPVVVSEEPFIPYLGIEAQIRHMGFKKGFGDQPLFDSNYFQTNFFAGLNLNDYFGIEGGYELTTLKKKEGTKFRGETILGTPILFFENSLTVKAQNRINGWHLNLVGSCPIFDESPLALIGSIGLARLTARLDAKVTAMNGNIINPPWTKFPRQHKTVLKLMGGIKYTFINCVGIRGTIGWEQTSKFKNLAATTRQEVKFLAKYKDSIIFNLGLFYNF